MDIDNINNNQPIDNVNISYKDMLFLLSCYFYVNAAKISQEALINLDRRLLVIDSIHAVKKADELVSQMDQLEKQILPDMEFVDITLSRE